MSELIDEFMAAKKAKAENDAFELSPNTLRNYQTVTNHFTTFMAEREIDDVTDVVSMDIDEFIESYLAARLAGSSIKNYYNSLRPLFNYLNRKGHIDDNPMNEGEFGDYQINSDSPKRDDPNEPVYIEPEDKDALLDNVGGHKLRNRLIISLMWTTGMRVGEVAKLEIEKHVDTDAGEIHIPSEISKSKSSRHVWYDDGTAENNETEFYMDLWLNKGHRDSYVHSSDSPYLFLSERGIQLSEKAINDAIKEAAEKAELQAVAYEGNPAETDNVEHRTYHQVTSHVLRHSYGVQKARSGMKIKQLSMLMGHETTNTTEMYLKLAKKDLKRAAQEHMTDVTYDDMAE